MLTELERESRLFSLVEHRSTGSEAKELSLSKTLFELHIKVEFLVAVFLVPLRRRHCKLIQPFP